MADEDLTAESDDDTPTIRKLRAALKEQSKENKTLRSEVETTAAEARALRTEKMFEEAGVPQSARALMQKALADVEDLDVEKIRAEAASAGLITESTPAPVAGEGEQAMHTIAATALSDAPAPPADLLAQMAQAATPEEVLRLAAQGGVEIEAQ